MNAFWSGGRRRSPRDERRRPIAASPSDHLVHFYDEQEALLQSVASFLAGGLLRGGPALVIAMPERLASLEARLREMGVDVPRAVEAQQLVLYDSIEMIERILVDEMPDARRFQQVVGAAAAGMTEAWRPLKVHAFGDMVDVLIARGQHEATIELERLWDELAPRIGLSIYCAYDAKRFRHDSERATFDAICRHHDAILPADPVERPPELPA